MVLKKIRHIHHPPQKVKKLRFLKKNRREGYTPDGGLFLGYPPLRVPNPLCLASVKRSNFEILILSITQTGEIKEFFPTYDI